MNLYRKQATILVNLFSSDEPINGVLLSQRSNVSLKTLKKEIDEINEGFYDKGFAIVSRTGLGYEIEVHEPVIFNEFKNETKAMFYRNEFFRNSQADMIHYIIRQVLVKDNTYINQIANDCFCSISTVNRCMQSVRVRIQDYGLKLENHTNSGMRAEGNEWLFRLALVNEYKIYHDFKSSSSYRHEESFEKEFIGNHELRNMLEQKAEEVLHEYSYIIPFDAVRKLVYLCILTITRRKYSSALHEDFKDYPEIECMTETDIVKTIFSSLPDSKSTVYDDEEIRSIAVFLKANQVIYYTQFAEMRSYREISDLVNGFFKYAKDRINFEGMDMTEVKKDLACNLASMEIKSKYDIHGSHADTNHFLNDGLISLDCCAILYLYLKNNASFTVQKRDALNFYYIFSRAASIRNESKIKKVLIVSRYGFYYSKNLANICGRIDTQDQLYFIPCEFLDIRNYDLNEIYAIATDIDEIRHTIKSKPIYMIHYYREKKQLYSMIHSLMNSKEEFMAEIFHKEDLIYLDGAMNLEEIVKYLSDTLLTDQKKTLFSR